MQSLLSPLGTERQKNVYFVAFVLSITIPQGGAPLGLLLCVLDLTGLLTSEYPRCRDTYQWVSLCLVSGYLPVGIPSSNLGYLPVRNPYLKL